MVIVAADIRAHPGTPIKDVATRTGFPQSKVSACVARLREAGAVETRTDPADRRRTIVSPARAVSPRVAEVRSAGIDGILTRVLEDPERLDEVKAALSVIAEHLGPSALTRIGD